MIWDTDEHRELYRGMLDGKPVWRIVLKLPHGCVALLHPNAGLPGRSFQNLVSCGPGGDILWRAELPDIGCDAYVEACADGDLICANSWSCFRVEINAENGRILSSTFTK
ncbi:MAG: hypothetical protein ACO1SX_07075 [Actinomycetota bacterium]